MIEEGQKDETAPDNPKKENIFLRIGRFLARTFIIIVLLLLLLSLLIQTPEIQEWAAEKASDFLSEELEADVQIGGFRLNFLDKLVLKDIIVSDNSDTLLVAGEITADFKSPIFTILRKRLDLQNIILRNTSVHMIRRAGEDDYNIQKLLQNINSEEKKKSDEESDIKGGIALRIKLDNIFLQKLEFLEIDSLYGSSLKVNLERGRLQVDEIDLNDPSFSFHRLRLIQPFIEIEHFESSKEYVQQDTAGDIPILFVAKSLQIDDGTFILNDQLSERLDFPYPSMDYGHLSIHEINIDARDVKFYDWETTARSVNNISLMTQEGFTLKSLVADSLRVNPTAAHIHDSRILSDQSDIKGDIHFDYSSFRDWRNFNDDVVMNIHSKNSKVFIQDIMNFAPGLYDNELFLHNAHKHATIDGIVQGTVNNMKIRGVYASLDSLFIRGNLDLKNATDPEKLHLKINLSDSRIVMKQVEKLVPNLTLDNSFYSLGTTRFTGTYRGTLNDFKVNTKMYSGIGNGEFDVSMILKDTPEDASYYGNIVLHNFDLGKFIRSDSIGAITLDMKVNDGKGLTLESIDAHLEGKIDSVELKRYMYQDISIDGRASNKLFKGEFSILDDNIDLDLEGNIYFADFKKPTLDIDLSVKYMDLEALNIEKEPLKLKFHFSGRVDSFDVYNLNANSLLENLEINYRDSLNLALSTFQIIASSSPNKDNKLEIESDIIDANVVGDYSWIKSGAALKNYFIASFPALSKRWKLEKDTIAYESKLEFDIAVKNTLGFQVLLDDKLDTVKNLNLVGIVNTEDRKMRLNIHTPHIQYGTNSFENVYLALYSGNGIGNVVMGVDSTVLNDKISLSPFMMAGDLTYDTLSFNLNLADYSKDHDNFNIDGKVFPTTDNYALVFKDRYVNLFNNEWFISPNNYIEVGSHFLHIDSLLLKYEDKLISFQSDSTNHIDFKLENIALSTFNDNIASDSLNMYGNLSLAIDLDDIYNLRNVQGSISVEDLRINEDDYGFLTVNVFDDGTGTQSDVDIKAIHENQKFYARGSVRPRELDNFYDLHVSGEEVPFTILQYLLYESISNTVGKVDADLNVTGAIDAPEVHGNGRIYDARTKFDLLGVTYFVKDAEFSITPEFIDLSGGKVYDEYDNVAHIEGGLLHDNFNDFGADITISSKKFLLLNTTKEINSFYYGRAIGSAEVTIDGSFIQPNINIVAENAENTEFYMSLFETEEVEDAAFVRFVDSADSSNVVEENKISSPEGLNLRLNLTANERGRVKIFMDKDEDNYIEGTGNGNIILDLKRTGDLSMFGTYNISSGTYRYSFNFIKRTFKVREGGYVQWTGDPLDATMNIVADYSAYASPYTLLSSYNLSRAEVPPTPVHVLIYLNGPILQPSIEFDVEIPEAQANISPYVDNALASLRADQSKLEFQALSLITLGDFWPDETSGSGIVYSGGANTLTGFLSSQVSDFLSTIVNQALRNVGFIDYIDVDVNVNYMANNEIDLDGLEGDPSQVGANEVQVNLKNFLFDERAIIEVGGNYVEGSAISSGSYLKGNVALEYVLTEDRRLRVKLFTNTDQNIEGYQVKSGVGLRYQREFDSFDMFYNNLVEALEKLKPKRLKESNSENDTD